MSLAGCRCLWGILLSPFVLFCATHSCRADLVNAGDIAFIGFNTDGNDDFAFVLLADAAIGNVVHFNDNEWVGTQFNATNEGEISWTVTTALSAGTVVTFSNLATSPTASTGTITTNGDVMALSGGEAIYAFTGVSATNPTTFLAAFSNDERIYDDSNQVDGTLSGTGLIEGSTAVLVARNGTDPADGGQYAGARSGEAAFGDYRSLIGNTNANWNVHYTDGTQFVPFDATSFTVLTASTPEADSLGLATLGLFLLLVIRRSQPGIMSRRSGGDTSLSVDLHKMGSVGLHLVLRHRYSVLVGKRGREAAPIRDAFFVREATSRPTLSSHVIGFKGR